MKRLLPLSLCFLFVLTLSGCGKSTTIRYRATWDDAERASILNASIERVLTRRFSALEVQKPAISVIPENQTSAVITVDVTSSEDADKVIHVFESPFTFDLRIDGGTIDQDGVEVTDWQASGVDGSMLDWAQAIGNRDTGEVSVELQFNEVGQSALETLANEQNGKRLGIFVRDVLVSVVLMEAGAFSDTVIIGGIPSGTVAEIFADDVNVGLRVTFTPQ